MSTKPQLELSDEELEDRLSELFSQADFAALFALAEEQDEDDFWKEKAERVMMRLNALGIDLPVFQRYVRYLDENCDIEIIRTTFILNVKHGIKIQMTVGAKHVTEGGRISEQMNDMMGLKVEAFTVEELKQLYCVTFSLIVDAYSDDEELDESSTVDVLCDIEGKCYCPACVAERADDQIGDEDEDAAAEDSSTVPNKTLH